MLQISSTGCVIRENPLKLWKRRRKASGIHPRPLPPKHRIGNQPDRQDMFDNPEVRPPAALEPSAGGIFLLVLACLPYIAMVVMLPDADQFPDDGGGEARMAWAFQE